MKRLASAVFASMSVICAHAATELNEATVARGAALSRRAAAESMVLLKNEGETLPMDNTKTVSVFGITSYDFIYVFQALVPDEHCVNHGAN